MMFEDWYKTVEQGDIDLDKNIVVDCMKLAWDAALKVRKEVSNDDAKGIGENARETFTRSEAKD